MFELKIRKADTSPYWTAYFNSLTEAQAWLAEEQTRPYWKQNHIVEIIDRTPPPPTAEEVQARIDKNNQMADLHHRLKNIAQMLDGDVSASIVKESVIKLIKLLILKDGLK